MNVTVSPEVGRLIRERVLAGGYTSEDEVLRSALGALAERDELDAAIRESIADLDEGRVRTLADADAEFSAKRGIPHDE